MAAKPKVGISACLLGEPVRFDGAHKRDEFLTESLGLLVEWVPICPEVECGLPVPREAMRLVGDPDFPRLVTVSTRIDHTRRLLGWTIERLDELADKDLSGFVLKCRSPSCGVRDAPVYDLRGELLARGAGLFARSLMDRFVDLPVVDEEGISREAARKDFIDSVMKKA